MSPSGGMGAAAPNVSPCEAQKREVSRSRRRRFRFCPGGLKPAAELRRCGKQGLQTNAGCILFTQQERAPLGPKGCLTGGSTRSPLIHTPLESPAFPLAIGWYTRQFSPSIFYTPVSRLPGTPLRFAPFETQTNSVCFVSRCLTNRSAHRGTVLIRCFTFVGEGLLNLPR